MAPVGYAVLRKAERDSKGWVDAAELGRGEVEKVGQTRNSFKDSLKLKEKVEVLKWCLCLDLFLTRTGEMKAEK